ncbi:hypothetical protein HK405_013920, partial [Cladochytrium tenue]
NAMANANASEVLSVDIHSGSVKVIDVASPDAYPITIITNFVLRDGLLSNDTDTTTDISAAIDSAAFVPVFGTAIANVSFAYLKSYQLPGASQPLFGQSVCDRDEYGVQLRPCVHGYCAVDLPFQGAATTCVCPSGFLPGATGDCSVPAPVFAVDASTDVQLALAAAAAAAVAAVSALVVVHRAHPAIRAIAPVCCYVILAGCMLGAAAILAYAASPTDTICKIRVFFPSVGFAVVFGMLFFKTYRIYLIFGYVRVSSALMLRNNKLIMYTGGLVAIQLALTGLYVGVSQPVSGSIAAPSQSSSSSALVSSSTTAATSTSSAVICQASSGRETLEKGLLSLIYVFDGVILLACIFLAWKTRGAYKRYKETKAIAFLVYAIAVAFALAVPIIYSIPVDNTTSLNVLELTRTGLFFVVTVGTPMFLFVPRIYEVLEEKREAGTDGPHDAKPVQFLPGGLSPNSGAMGAGGGAMQMAMHESSNASELEFDDWLATKLTQMATFRVGARANRFTAAWLSCILVVLPEADLAILLKEAKPDRAVASFRLSTSAFDGLPPATGGGGGAGSAMEDAEPASPATSQRQSIRRRGSAVSMAGGGGGGRRLVRLLPGAAARGGGGNSSSSGGYLMEFSSEARTVRFARLVALARAGSGGGATGLGLGVPPPPMPGAAPTASNGGSGGMLGIHRFAGGQRLQMAGIPMSSLTSLSVGAVAAAAESASAARGSSVMRSRHMSKGSTSSSWGLVSSMREDEEEQHGAVGEPIVGVEAMRAAAAAAIVRPSAQPDVPLPRELTAAAVAMMSSAQARDSGAPAAAAVSAGPGPAAPRGFAGTWAAASQQPTQFPGQPGQLPPSPPSSSSWSSVSKSGLGLGGPPQVYRYPPAHQSSSSVKSTSSTSASTSSSMSPPTGLSGGFLGPPAVSSPIEQPNYWHQFHPQQPLDGGVHGGGWVQADGGSLGGPPVPQQPPHQQWEGILPRADSWSGSKVGATNPGRVRRGSAAAATGRPTAIGVSFGLGPAGAGNPAGAAGS